jgi:hypothetical protein
MIKRIVLLVAVAAALAAALGTAQAANSESSGRLLATPSNACRAILEVNAMLHIPPAYSSFGECVGRFNRDVAAYRFPDDATGQPISLDQRCRQFEEGIFDPTAGEVFQITYPFTFDEGPEWPFPVFTAQNHIQCENALFGYHSFFGGE